MYTPHKCVINESPNVGFGVLRGRRRIILNVFNNNHNRPDLLMGHLIECICFDLQSPIVLIYEITTAVGILSCVWLIGSILLTLL